MQLLITGAASGLGRYLKECLGGIGFTRTTDLGSVASSLDGPLDAIIHCAFNSSRGISTSSLLSYCYDNAFLTKELTKIPHKKFVHISTADVYPCAPGPHQEDAEIFADNLNGVYAVTKLLSEAYVQEYYPNYVIARPSTLLGKYSRPNTLTRILKNSSITVKLSADSLYNVVRYRDVKDFVELCILDDLRGIYNLAATGVFRLGDYADWLGKSVTFGDIVFRVRDIDNRKVASLLPNFSKTSKENVLEFARHWAAARNDRWEP